jgi:hypothetical protein
MLASRLGISLWKLDEVERGRSDGSRLLADIAAATGRPQRWFVPEPDAAPAPGSAASASQTLDLATKNSRNLVLGAMALLVLIRFFTEVVHLVPRALNFIDVPLFVVLAVAAAARARRAQVGASGFFALPTFLFRFLAPIGVYTAVYRLWPTGHPLSASRFLVALGLIELLVVFAVDLPRFVSSGNPDLVSGTFGTNAYQLVFFLLVFTGLLAGVRTTERRRLAAQWAPALFALVLATIFLAQYRALLVTTAVSIAVIGLLLGRRGRGLVTGVIIVVSFGFTLSYVSSHFPHLKFSETIATLGKNPGSYAAARLHAARNVVSLYEDKPLAIALGTGPGTFSSRAWQTFAQAGSSSQSNVQGSYALALTGGSIYRTDVSDKYVLPETRSAPVIEGSRQLASPFATFLSLPAEIGLPGLLLILFIYCRATLRSARMTVTSLRHARSGDPLPGLLIASTIAFTVLLQMGFLDGNWFEVTRVTFLSWALFAIVSKEYESRQELA